MFLVRRGFLFALGSGCILSVRFERLSAPGIYIPSAYDIYARYPQNKTKKMSIAKLNSVQLLESYSLSQT